MNSPLISIIMPAFNSEKHISEAIESVIAQTHSNWELIIINDGSNDNSEKIISSFLKDKRISLFTQTNKGVSAARNLGLKKMTGDYFCFLDADDIFPKNSLKSRVKLFDSDNNLSFVDGRVLSKDESLKNTLDIYQPSFKGKPLNELVRLNDSCLLGNTWMIKRDHKISYQFTTGLTHAEDLCFYLSICHNKNYNFVNEEVLWYRRNEGSAMSNLKGLENGYIHTYICVKRIEDITLDQLVYLKRRIMRIMFLSWLIDGKKPLRALISLWKINKL